MICDGRLRGVGSLLYGRAADYRTLASALHRTQAHVLGCLSRREGNSVLLRVGFEIRWSVLVRWRCPSRLRHRVSQWRSNLCPQGSYCLPDGLTSPFPCFHLSAHPERRADTVSC